LPAEEWHEWPDWMILKKWSGVQRIKAEEINSLSGTVSQIAAMVHSYMKAQAKDSGKISDLTPGDFLPYRLEKEKETFFDPETAEILVEALKAGEVPVYALQIIVDCGLYDELIQLGDKEK
jgi:hypothetical protein